MAAQKTQESSWSILSGPSKYDLMLALFDRTMDRPRPVTFKIEMHSVIAHVVSVSIEDGTGDSWLIELQSSDFGRYFHGHYNSDRRTGTLEPGLRHSKK